VVSDFLVDLCGEWFILKNCFHPKAYTFFNETTTKFAFVFRPLVEIINKKK
jgi:hypothetical protein